MARTTPSNDGAYYPNSDMLWTGLGIYLTEMSQFIVRVMREEHGSQLEQAVADSLHDMQRLVFYDDLKKNGGDVARSINIGLIPFIVERNWDDFQHQFTGAISVRTLLRSIRDCRNEMVWVIYTDADADATFVLTGLDNISEVLKGINRPDQAKEVMDLWNQVVSRAGDSTPEAPDAPTPAPIPQAKASNSREQIDSEMQSSQ